MEIDGKRSLESMYSRMDQVKFVEDVYEVIWPAYLLIKKLLKILRN